MRSYSRTQQRRRSGSMQPSLQIGLLRRETRQSTGPLSTKNTPTYVFCEREVVTHP